MRFMSGHGTTDRANTHVSPTNPPIRTFPEVGVGFRRPLQTGRGLDRQPTTIQMGRGQGTSRQHSHVYGQIRLRTYMVSFWMSNRAGQRPRWAFSQSPYWRTHRRTAWLSPWIKYYKPSSKTSWMRITPIGMTNSIVHSGHTAQRFKQELNPPPFGWHSDSKQSCQSSSRYRVHESKSWNGCLSLNPNNIDSNKSSNSGNTGSQALFSG